MSGPLEDETEPSGQALLRAVAEHVSCAFVVLGPDGTPRTASAGARDLLGLHHASDATRLLGPGPAGTAVAAALRGEATHGVPLPGAGGPATLLADFLPALGGVLVRCDAGPAHLHHRFFEHSRDLLCVADHETRFLRLSPSWTDCLGWRLDEMLGRSFLDFVHPDDLEDTRREARRLAENEEVVRFENRYRCRDGTYRWLQWNSSAPAGGPVYAVARDVTDQRSATKQLHAAYEALHEAEQNRLRLFQHVVHDIATPLSAMGLQLALLESGSEPEDIERLRRVHEHLQRLVDDVRDLSLAESRQLRLRRSRVPVQELLTPTLDALQAAADARDVRLTSAVEEMVLDVDPLRFNQIAYNLVTNAIKFTWPGGHVHVTLHRGADAARLTVEDDGEGLDAADLERLFQPFVQVDDSDRPQRGSGLGLYICKQLAEAHGGRIWAESAGRGAGSRFHVELPAA